MDEENDGLDISHMHSLLAQESKRLEEKVKDREEEKNFHQMHGELEGEDEVADYQSHLQDLQWCSSTC